MRLWTESEPATFDPVFQPTQLHPMKNRPQLRFIFLVFLASFLFCGLIATAQPLRPAAPSAQIARRADSTPELVRYESTSAPSAAEAPTALRTTLGLSAQNELRPSQPAETDELGYTHQKYQQFYQGVPVEFTAYTTHCRAGKVEFMTGETRLIADGALSVRPALTAAAALSSALRFVHAKQYMWELPNEGKAAREAEGKPTYRPTGELVIVDNQLAADPARRGRPVLAWKFNIYAAQPVSRAWVYVDAQTGEVVNENAIATSTTTRRPATAMAPTTPTGTARRCSTATAISTACR